jgi:hypothetical protein
MPTRGPFTPDQLHVVAVISNPMRFASRIRLYKEFKERMLRAGVTFWTIEVAYGDRPFEVTEPGDPQSIQMRTWTELWHKENMANIMIANLPADAEYVALVDADVAFMRDDWAVETIQMLQHHYVVQMWQDCLDMGPDGQVMERFQSFMYRYVNGMSTQKMVNDKYNSFGHPGFAWAYRREALELLGGNLNSGGPLLDTAILGAADHHMALAYVGRAEQTIPGNINQAYYDAVMIWQERALRHLSKDVGYVRGSLYHYFHGKKKDRNYIGRWDILIQNDYVPHLDLRRDINGLYALTERNLKLRDDIRRYFRQRNEDSIDMN